MSSRISWLGLHRCIGAKPLQSTTSLSNRLLRQSPLLHATQPRRCFHASRSVLAPPESAQSRPLNTTEPKPQDPPRRGGHATASLIASVGLLSLVVGLSEPESPAARGDNLADASSDDRDRNLPRFTLSEVKQHGADSGRPWVTYRDKVYDITDWIPAHPGGEVILRAAGASIDPYWDIFSIHKSPHVYEILDQYLIGYIDSTDLVDGKPLPEKIEDPFKDDPGRDPRLVTLTSKPRNAETPLAELADSFVTPNELFYVRNHMWVPKIEDPEQHTLTVELLDGSTKEYTLRDLKTRFKPIKIAATLQCSGNRRKDMTDHAQKTNGLQWNVGAISCAVWEGVRLADVLADAGFPLDRARAGDTDARHVQFSGEESYGASIPLGPVIDPCGDVLLAYSMNGAPLPPDHGFPLRALVPGHVAARSVKWLKRVIVSDEESQSQWQQRDYKLFGPNVVDPDWSKAPAIQEMPITSAITDVELGEWTSTRSSVVKHRGNTIPPQQEQKEACDERSPDSNGEGSAGADSTQRGRKASLSGYAYSGGGRRIIRVDVSLDNGKTWDQADLFDNCVVPGPDRASPCNGHKSWAWRRWRYEGVIPFGQSATNSDDQSGEKPEPATQSSSPTTPPLQKQEDGGGNNQCTTLLVKATDEAYNAQPEGHGAIWNLRGNLANAWHRLRVCSESECQGKKPDLLSQNGK